jgi:hypothetical protein
MDSGKLNLSDVLTVCAFKKKTEKKDRNKRQLNFMIYDGFESS